MLIDFVERKVVGKGVSALREQGMTPIVCYGKGQESMPYSVRTRDLISSLSSDEVVFDTSGSVSGEKVLLQDVSYHPVSGLPLHADFLLVDADHQVEYEVPIQIEGESPAVKTHMGQMIVVMDKIEIRALPQDIPGHFTVNVNSLKLVGSHIQASDIMLPEGVTLVTNPDEIIISIVEQSQFEEEEEKNETDIESIEVTSTRGKKEEESSSGDVTG